MSAAVEVPQIQKRRYRNNTAGFIGVVTLDHLGQELGVSVEPGGEIWLSNAEAVLTARAPKDPKDNPFLPTDFSVLNPQTNEREMVTVTPISLVSDESRSVYGDDRPVPGITDDFEARVLVERAAREGSAGPVTPAMVSANRVSAEDEDEIKSWVQPPVAPGQVVQSQLSGTNEPAPTATAGAAPTAEPSASETTVPAAAQEETAAAEGEEHGANTNGVAEVEGSFIDGEEHGDVAESNDGDAGLLS